MRIRWRDGSWWRLLEVAEDGLPLRAVLDEPGEYVLHVWGLAGQPGAAREFMEADLSDLPTLGAVLGLVRERWGDPTLTPYPIEDEGWGLRKLTPWANPSKLAPYRWPTEAEALIAALEAAPEVEP